MAKPIPITPEGQEFLTQLLREREAANQRLEIAVLSMKTVLGVPLDWDIKDLKVGFIEREEVKNNGNDNGLSVSE